MKVVEDNTKDKDVIAAAGRRPWTSPKLNKIGILSEVLGAGGGKLSIAGGDPGDGLKQSGTL